MKANYGPRLDIPGLKRGLSRGETEVAIALSKYYDEQCEEREKNMCMVVMGAVLLALNQRYHWTSETLYQVWRDSVTIRHELRRQFREPGYQPCPTGKNVEDAASEQYLRLLGVLIDDWETSVDYNPESGELVFEDLGFGKKKKR